jgi:hypothetical protein
MHGDGRINQIAPKCPQPRQRAFLVGAGQLAVTGHIRSQDCCEFSGLGHDVLLATIQTSTMTPFKADCLDRLASGFTLIAEP